jgi:hypothetical protein
MVAGLGSIVNNLSTNTASQDSLAKYAQLNSPTYIYSSDSGIYFSELSGKIRKITLQAQTSQPITTILPYGPLSIIANYSRNTYNTTVSTISTCEKMALMQNFNTTSVCCDMANNVYFPDTNTKTIMKMDSGGNLSIFAGPFTTAPIGIANYKDTYIYATNGTNITAYLFSTGAAQALTYTLAGCSNIAISPIGLMYVSNTANTNISIYNLKTGAAAAAFTISVTQATTIDSLCVDTDLNLYVGKTYTGTYKISKYDSTNTAQGTTADIGYKVSSIAYSKGA